LEPGPIPDGRPAPGLFGSRGPEEYIHAMAFTADSKKVATGDYDGTLRIFALPSGKIDGTYRNPRSSDPKCLSFSPDGQRLAFSTERYAEGVLDLATSRELWHSSKSERRVNQLAFSPDGQRLLLGLMIYPANPHSANTGGVAIWDAGTGKELASLGNEHQQVFSIAWSANGRWLAAGGGESRVHLWQSDSLQEWLAPEGNRGSIDVLAFTPDSRRLLTGAGNGTIRLWDLASCKVLRLVGQHEAPLNSLDINRSGTLIASASSDQTAALWSVENGRMVRLWQLKPCPLPQLRFIQDGKTLAMSGAETYQIFLHDVTSGAVLRCYPDDPEDGGWVFFVSPDQKLLLTQSGDTTITLYEAITGKRLCRFEANTKIQEVVFAPDSRTIALAGSMGGIWRKNSSADFVYDYGGKGCLLLFDAMTGKQTGSLVLSEEDRLPSSMVFSPDGRFLLAAVDERRVRVWDVRFGKVVRTWPMPQVVRKMRVSPDKRLLAVGQADGTVLIYDFTGWIPSN
jgi:WD40 repeat protein